jgi:hypothetical protein
MTIDAISMYQGVRIGITDRLRAIGGVGAADRHAERQGFSCGSSLRSTGRSVNSV